MPAVTVVLVRPRFPENIGMAARACANMGASGLTLVAPERWEYDKAAPLATGKGLEVLNAVRVADSLAEAVAGHSHAFGLTARTGGWRQGVMPPRKAAAAVNEYTAQGGSVALVFGPEDRGLENLEIELCTNLVTIPTAPGASSLNLAQAVLLMLYECFTASLEHAYHPAQPVRGRKSSRQTTVEEQELLFATLRQTLLDIEFLPENNPDWFMQPLRRFFRRAVPRKHEFDIFMGIFRRMRRFTQQ